MLATVLGAAVFFFGLVGGRAAQAAVLPEAGPAVTSGIDYALPYPGILPDSPVYFLKVWRDDAVLWLTRDSTEKSFFLLLMADKRLAAARMLTGKGEKGLGATTAVLAENYFSRAVTQVENQQSGKRSEGLLAKLAVAGAKHTEVIGELANEVSGRDSAAVQMASRENLESRNRVQKLLTGAVKK